MKVYLDASFLVALLSNDALTDRAELIWSRPFPVAIVSDFAGAEFASVVSRRVRTGDLQRQAASTIFDRFDSWLAASERVETTSADIRAAEAMMRRLDLPLRTPDALNIALAQRVQAALATFDRQMAAAARALGLDVIE